MTVSSASAGAPAPAARAGDRVAGPAQRPGLTLLQAARVFFGQASPLILAPLLAAAAAARLWAGRWSAWDLLVPAVVVGLQPFTEWLIHVFVLHFRPRRVGRFRVDPLVSRKHRAHHADPKDLGLVFIPLPVVVSMVVALAGVFLATMPLHRALTAIVSTYAMTLVYEWTHYLIHSAYRPRHRLYRYVWRAHRNHHFRNENYWFGVTMHAADHLLGTFPERTAVEVSPTARTLGVDAA